MPRKKKGSAATRCGPSFFCRTGLLPKGTLGERTRLARHAESALAQGGQLLARDLPPGQQPGQDHVKGRGLVEQRAGRNPDDLGGPDTPHQGHGAGQHGHAEQVVPEPGIHQGGPGHVVRVHGHARRGHDQVAPLVEHGGDRLGDGCAVVGHDVRGRDLAAELDHLGGDDGREFVLDESLEDLGARDQDADLGRAQGQDLQDRAVAQGGQGAAELVARDVQGHGAGPGHPLALGHDRAVVPGGQHHVGREIEPGHGLAVDGEHARTAGEKVDLALVGVGVVGDSLARHALGERLDRVVLVHPFVAGQLVLGVDVELADALQPAHIAHAQDVALLGYWSLGLAGHDAGHVVGRLPAHGFLHRDRAQGRGVVQADRALHGHVRVLALAAPANGAVIAGVSLAADRADVDGGHVSVAQVFPVHHDGPDGEDGVARLLDLGKELVRVLLGLGLLLHEPGPDFRPVLEFLLVHGHAHALARELVVERHRVPAQQLDLHPVVARGAQGQQLHRVGQAFAGLHQRLEQRTLGNARLGRLHHVPADEQTGGRIAVKFLGFFLEFLERVFTDIHARLAGQFRGASVGRPGLFFDKGQ